MSEGHVLDWDSEIENDGSGGEFVLLEPGDYPFQVVELAKKRHGGSPKLPPCPKAEAKLAILDDQGRELTTVNHNLFLHSKCEGLLCEFFRGIGHRQHGQRFSPDWSRVVGAQGWVKIGNRKWTNKEGEVKDSNEVKKFLDPAPTEGGADAPGF